MRLSAAVYRPQRPDFGSHCCRILDKLFRCPSLHRLAHARRLQACGAHRYDVMQYIVFPATKGKRCSYVELVAPEGTTAQTPTWFVSHWYGRRVLSDMESVISMSGCELETLFPVLSEHDF